MNRLFITFGLLFILIVPQAWPATSQYPDPNRVTMWNSITDSMHTWGQKPRQAQMTKMQLRNARAIARLKSIKQAKIQAMIRKNNEQQGI